MPNTDALLSLFVNKEMGAQKIEPIATSPTGEKGQSQNPTPYPSQPQPWVPEDTSFPLRPQDMSFMQTKYGVIVMAVTSNEPFYFQNPTVISHRICYFSQNMFRGQFGEGLWEARSTEKPGRDSRQVCLRQGVSYHWEWGEGSASQEFKSSFGHTRVYIAEMLWTWFTAYSSNSSQGHWRETVL